VALFLACPHARFPVRKFDGNAALWPSIDVRLRVTSSTDRKSNVLVRMLVKPESSCTSASTEFCTSVLVAQAGVRRLSPQAAVILLRWRGWLINRRLKSLVRGRANCTEVEVVACR
jgi:hypothetical protein